VEEYVKLPLYRVESSSVCVGGVDKAKWIEEERKEMEEDVKHHRYGNFFRRMRKLATPAVLLL